MFKQQNNQVYSHSNGSKRNDDTKEFFKRNLVHMLDQLSAYHNLMNQNGKDATSRSKPLST